MTTRRSYFDTLLWNGCWRHHIAHGPRPDYISLDVLCPNRKISFRLLGRHIPIDAEDTHHVQDFRTLGHCRRMQRVLRHGEERAVLIVPCMPL